MALKRVLVANRGEIAIRVMRAVGEIGAESVAVYAEDDARCLHTRRADDTRALAGSGAAAYLDIDAVVAAAVESGSDAVHPGYGFLAENPALARCCSEAGLVFVGPTPEQLLCFGDKTAALALAKRCRVPVLRGTAGATDLEGARAFFSHLGEGGAVMIKAVAGGGGRGIRAVRSADELDAAFERCRSEARAAFGNGELYVEELIDHARHLEVQVIGDGRGRISHLGERECTIQRRNQKLVEVAPSPTLSSEMRDRLTEAAVRMAEAVQFQSLGTFEFLLDADDPERFAFIEANARLQVEHTVTEQVTGVDLVRAQLAIAGGATLDELGLAPGATPSPRGYAIQLRINTETMAADGTVRPSGGTLTAFEPPTGPGIRVDTHGYAGYRASPRYDSLLAKLIVHASSEDYTDAVFRAERALGEFRIEGVATNAAFLRALVQHPDVAHNTLTTGFVDQNAAAFVRAGISSTRFFGTEATREAALGLAGARIDTSDPLAVLEHGKRGGVSSAEAESAPPPPDPAAVAPSDGAEAVCAPLQGTIVSVDVAEGDAVRAGQGLFVMEAMKMEHVIAAGASGYVRRIAVSAGDTVLEGHALAFLETADVDVAAAEVAGAADLDHVRPDLAEVMERHAVGLDKNRPAAVGRRRKTGQRTARENVEDLCDPGSYVEYGALVVAAQRRRRSMDDLIKNTPADGMLAGIGTVNAAHFDERAAQCVVLSYDYTVLAGTQGGQNHRKKDRMFEIAERNRLPVVFFTEGGGGRPGDTDGIGSIGLECWAFHYFGRLSGLVPLVGINSGRCFAGNAALLGCCDVVIATENSNIGMGGPAMIEGGGLGIFTPEEVGPIGTQCANGVVDIRVADEAEAVRVAKKYLSYFQGPIAEWTCDDQRKLRSVIPENRLRIYDVRDVIDLVADCDSVLELRREFGLGMITSFIRVEGRSVGVVANNPVHLAGAIDSDGADKASRFMQLCDAFDIPILFLCDTPGIMVGPEVEKTALVRHAARMFVTAGSLDVPYFTIVLRKGYGLGAQAMAGASFKAPFFTVSWPTGEFGGMGLEGAVKLGYRKELAAIEDPEERRVTYQKMVDRMYEVGKAVNAASTFELDDVIDPMESRAWITTALRSAPAARPRSGKKRPMVDTW